SDMRTPAERSAGGGPLHAAAGGTGVEPLAVRRDGEALHVEVGEPVRHVLPAVATVAAGQHTTAAYRQAGTVAGSAVGGVHGALRPELDRGETEPEPGRDRGAEMPAAVVALEKAGAAYHFSGSGAENVPNVVAASSDVPPPTTARACTSAADSPTRRYDAPPSAVRKSPVSSADTTSWQPRPAPWNKSSSARPGIS